MPIDDVKRALDEKKRIVIIDARAAPDWYSSHIPGSISVPYYLFDRLDSLPRDGTNVDLAGIGRSYGVIKAAFGTDPPHWSSTGA